MPASYFPVSVLQNSQKITTEPPRGFKANLSRSLDSFDSQFLEDIPMREHISRLFLGVSAFHALVQERRKFGPLGWNILYEFNDSDYEASKEILTMFFKDIDQRNLIPWDSLLFLTGVITYGGRVTDDLDQRLLITTLKKFYNSKILSDKFRFCSLDNYKFPKNSDIVSLKIWA